MQLRFSSFFLKQCCRYYCEPDNKKLEAVDVHFAMIYTYDKIAFQSQRISLRFISKFLMIRKRKEARCLVSKKQTKEQRDFSFIILK